MSYNHVRANIRNAMVGLSMTEVQEFVAGAIERCDWDAVSYATEWGAELREEEGDCVDPAECSGEHYQLACTD